jgi:2-polyprenyl-3-methyl-5-hydroxy-6-metoxy-1,4-benzoquinol methylase
MTEFGTDRTCDLCDKDNFKAFVEVSQFERTIVKCTNCGLVFVHPINPTNVTFDYEGKGQREDKYRRMRHEAEVTGKHDEEMIRREEKIRTLHFRNRRDKIERYMRTGRLLDIGCGRGFFLSNFLDSGFDYLGLEPRRRISKKAEERVGEKRVFCGTLKEANFPDEHFHVVTMINLIEHLPSPRDVLQEVNRVLANNGLLLIETPDVGSILARILREKWHAFLESEHQYFFSKETLTALLMKMGFRVEETSKAQKLFSLRYLMYRMGWYNKKAVFCFNKLLDGSSFLERTFRIPQFDELVVFARKNKHIRVSEL